MYNDLILDRLVALPEDEKDERIQQLIDEIEALDSLLSPEARELIHHLRPRTVSDDVYEEIDETSTLGDRMADWLASMAGSWRFIISFVVFMALWMGSNLALGDRALDPAPFILLNLALSTLAGLQAPVILMAQNRQASKDRLVAENDYQVNLKNELEIVDLHRKIDTLMNTVEVQNKMVNVLVAARRQELNATVHAIKDNRETV
ncbi:DUF1003 domain-containing protein [Phototrophicus methaneseepsis]|uniref:DUF1003 domain-containing protein n=1 Tax=Phototrophicus methaneseepsis TaxID=2710758 RepID=A0A7S8ED60_9CHLR|nr:DUF1003 domain-containing protein [Phototrophicus methaneseepsis]QPC84563.1 DUF1003 domain-containing protein [Phototrophicus methaneseepsis]